MIETVMLSFLRDLRCNLIKTFQGVRKDHPNSENQWGLEFRKWAIYGQTLVTNVKVDSL